MSIVLRMAEEQDAQRLWEMQVSAFEPLLRRYQDFSTNPACEQADAVLSRIRQTHTDYYVIEKDGMAVGGVRVVRRDGERCRISPLYVLPEHQRQGIAQNVMRQLENMYPDVVWELNTILQETGNCRLYEKMGYRRTGELEQINERMTLVYYRKLPRKK